MPSALTRHPLLSNRLVQVGLLGVALVVLLAVVAAAQGWWWLVVLCGMLMLTAILAVALDADRRVRELRAFVRAQIAALDTTGGRGAPSEEDVVGAVRLLQAQYTGRLDRLQDSIEALIAQGRPDDRG